VRAFVRQEESNTLDRVHTASVKRSAVLCATYALSRSDAAVGRAGLIARALDAELFLLYVIDSGQPPRVARRRSALAYSILDAHTRKLARAGVIAQVSIRSGNPYEVIAAAAVELDADLIVLGPYRSRFADALRGTSAERIARRAERPVLVVNRNSALPYQQVLLAADLSPMTAGVGHVAKTLGLLKRSRASVVHALEHTRKGMLYMAGLDEERVESFQRSLREIAVDEIGVQLASVGLEADHFTIFSPQAAPVRAIEDTAKLVGADLVVVGSSRFAQLKRVLFGSVSNDVLQRTEHDVLLVSPSAARRARRRSAAVAMCRLEADTPQRALSLH
jgi:universal stress protein E